MKIRYGELLSNHTSLKIGGVIFCWLEPENADDILEAAQIAEKGKKPIVVIGRGSNILASDNGFDGIVINLNRGFDFIEKESEDVLNVGAAVPISRLVRQSAKEGLSGCEFLSGIPGSFGGAVFMNAGVRDTSDVRPCIEVKDIISSVDIIDLKSKKRETLKKDKIDFSYRSSGLDGKCILGARLKLKKDDKKAVYNRINSFMKSREWINDLGFSAGSVFKNPDKENPAGRLIESCDLKGKRIGGAEISSKHANIIVNAGRAKSRDVEDLIELAKSRVEKKFNITLQLEIRII